MGGAGVGLLSGSVFFCTLSRFLWVFSFFDNLLCSEVCVRQEVWHPLITGAIH